ncbi:MAG: flagellar export chaperone FliS [Firmicutes bacterium HGW-Firmicutes-1]|jgi:flagellar protein FliS|nr:MAG: flagellar export chaperone FliS [Firmicutes bacterium HGW-Firmicutes-1]
MTTNKQDIYMSNTIMQASKEELTLMLYNGAIKFCNKAIMAINDNNMNDAHHNIVRVEDIISEFQASLNPEFEVTKSFTIMYDYLQRRLIEANIQKDISILEEVNGFLREFRDTWKEAMNIAKGKKPPINRLA